MCRCTFGRSLHTPDLLKIGQELVAQGNFQFYRISCNDVPFHYYEKVTIFDFHIENSKLLVITHQFCCMVGQMGYRSFIWNRFDGKKNIFLCEKMLRVLKVFSKEKTQAQISLIW